MQFVVTIRLIRAFWAVRIVHPIVRGEEMVLRAEWIRRELTTKVVVRGIVAETEALRRRRGSDESR